VIRVMHSMRGHDVAKCVFRRATVFGSTSVTGRGYRNSRASRSFPKPRKVIPHDLSSMAIFCMNVEICKISQSKLA